MRFRCFILFILTIFLPGLPGCGDKSDDEKSQQPDRPFAEQTVVIAVPSGYGFDERWELILREWSEQTGANYRFQEYDLRDEQLSLMEQFGHAETSGDRSPATLLVFPTTRLCELIDSNVVAEVPREEQAPTRLNWLDVFPGLRENVVAMGRRKWGAVPLSAPVPVFAYRKDLLDKAGLSPPETWDDYRELIAALDRWAPGLTAVEPWGEDFRATTFLSRAAAHAKHPDNYSFIFDISTGEPLIDTPGFVRALEEAVRDFKSMPQTVISFSPEDCRRELLAGKAAMAITCETAVPFDAEQKASLKRPEGIQIGFVALPGVVEPFNRSINAWQKPSDGRINAASVTGFSGLSAGVSTGCTPRMAQAAWNLLKRLTVDEDASAFPPGTKTLCRESKFETAAARFGEDYLPEEAYAFLNAVAASLRNKQLVCEIPVLGRERFRSALTSGLGKALDENTEPRIALDGVAKEWREIANEIGTKQVTNSYRQRLGLDKR